MKIERVLPDAGEVELDALLEGLAVVEPRLPFDPLLVEFVAALSQALTQGPEVRRYPEIVALGHWARKASVVAYQRDLEALSGPHLTLVPRGLVFHVPPANVDTIFMYSWLLSLLVGNVNLIRLSTRVSPQVELVCEKLGRVLDEARFAELRPLVAIVRYGHEDEVSARFSAAADLRVVWGGDATVEAMRAYPLAPHARELSFGDRFSFSVVGSDAYLAAPDAERQKLADRFFNDSMWFDQAGCSSPRLVVFRGSRDEGERASGAFFAALQAAIERRQHQVDVGLAIGKLRFTYEAALDGRLRAAERLSSELSVLHLDTLDRFDRTHPGAGLFFVAHVEALSELSPFVTRKDQTLAHYGVADEELAALTRALRGRGLDRMVPIGQALDFHRFWDGYDLLQELTRRVYRA